MTPRISAIIHTFNEEKNIRNALRSVHDWADECIVVDMHSEDNTVAIAESMGARIFFHERCGSADPARMFAEDQATGDWIFVLDADEIAPIELTKELLRIAKADIADVCFIPRINYFSGAPLMNSGWGPSQDMQLRFYRKGWITLSPLIHTMSTPKEGSRVLRIKYLAGHAIVHFNYVNAAHFLEKLNRYTTIEATQARQKGQSASLYRLIIRPILVFLDRFLRRGGYKDGWRGFYYCFMMLVYNMTAIMKLRELITFGDEATLCKFYQEVASDLEADRDVHKAKDTNV